MEKYWTHARNIEFYHTWSAKCHSLPESKSLVASAGTSASTRGKEKQNCDSSAVEQHKADKKNMSQNNPFYTLQSPQLIYMI
jgi:hypothetical protein